MDKTLKLSQRQYHNIFGKQKNKYNNKRVKYNGINFASQKEFKRYLYLLDQQAKGYIKDLVLQPRFELQEKFEKNGVKYRAITYVADFQYFDTRLNKTIVEDTKGFKKEKVFLLKQKMFEYRYKELNLQII